MTQRFTGVVVAGFAGNLLALVTWTLALADATRTRRWGWYVVAVLAGLVFFAAAIGFFLAPSILDCAFSITSTYCTTNGLTYYALAVTGTLVGPAVMLIYALRDVRRV